MSEKRLREIVAFIKKSLRQKKIAIEKVVLFGSSVQKRFTAESDVDVAIVSSDFEQKDVFQRSRMLSGLSWSLVKQFMLPFDIVMISFDEWEKSSSLSTSFIRQGREF